MSEAMTVDTLADDRHNRNDTSWVALASGVLGTLGAAAIFTPVVVTILGRIGANLDATSAAVPVLISLMLSTLLGGYIAGRVAGRKSGWHGALSGLLGIFVWGGYLLASVAVQREFLGIDDRAVPDFFPGVLTLTQYHSEHALAVGLIGLPAQVLTAWIGGHLAGLMRMRRVNAATRKVAPAV